MKRLFWYWYCRLFNRDQAYYWTKEWQEGERESEADYREGRYETFDSVEALIASLLAEKTASSGSTVTIYPDSSAGTS